MQMGDVIEKENKNKIRTENDILYCTIKRATTEARTYF